MHNIEYAVVTNREDKLRLTPFAGAVFAACILSGVFWAWWCMWGSDQALATQQLDLQVAAGKLMRAELKEQGALIKTLKDRPCSEPLDAILQSQERHLESLEISIGQSVDSVTPAGKATITSKLTETMGEVRDQLAAVRALRMTLNGSGNQAACTWAHNGDNSDSQLPVWSSQSNALVLTASGWLKPSKVDALP
jgi:hypothetical protein